mmetsp:Transcript_42293/g.117762  ORF Transcript_42293/g.117762 Transcript_42293/m.117762 type:complete len:377 (+) Transcript_42293:101-1231(+)|eukprot:CAMPEP_0176190462 /NCGR_PEP_ID=MMETSP0121_2-20121125/3951_1 /TAXON_ID=160619 /ORGANISM="Kryptoperidinium foliaceum, Strain CCMP 1326" /LENGTH=376 /DNA_ID=CAMNT_0017529085 /DNA_START=44 /DNA_END=1174 /DNA_ORIENTATION=+
MRAPRALLVGVLGFSSSHLAFGAPDLDADDCSGDACETDVSALLQHSVKHQRASFPDLGKLADKAKEAAKAVEDDAAAKINDFAGSALVAAAGKLNRTVEGYGRLAHEHATKMRNLSAQIRSGMKSLLSKAFNVSIPGFKPAEGDEEAAKDMLQKTTSWFDSMASSLEDTSKLADHLPSQFGELSKKANASLQSALQRCHGVEAPFAKVQRIVLHGGNGEGGGDSFVQTSRRVLEWGAIGQVSEAILAERGDPAKADASAMVAELNDAVKQATEQLSAFTDSFGEGFASLSSAVQETTKGKLSDDMVAKVKAAFDSVTSQAKDVATEAHTAYSGLLSSVSDAARGTGVAPSRGPLAAVPGAATLAVALAAMLYAGI